EALDAFYIDGIQHNIPFCSALMQHPRWRAGKLSTGFIPEEYPDGFKTREPQGEELDVIVAVAAGVDHRSNQRRREITQQMSGERVRFARQRMVRVGQHTVGVEISGLGEGPFQLVFRDKAGKPTRSMSVTSDWRPGDPVWNGKLDGKQVWVQIRP